ncbi:MAG: hypothetical protein KJ620_06595 [Candidatus Edwardsbacteria bacterium]|nr:hypothetical protein [Candidatus Edwardsbacteria bacterium]MBU1576061.1 hypothetical protein [Candidatus Edwardsbacteria bacterium]MBU2463663.1 hypothetical protein [Candidatus Edwardsbacteria bacterium]MBU2594131.1 hypothetical protein [Candidatus Edwardsbacteria bacterium]
MFNVECFYDPKRCTLDGNITTSSAVYSLENPTDQELIKRVLEDAAQTDSNARIRAEINRLPSEQHQVLLLWVDKDLTYQEISRVLRIPVGSVMSRLFRARQKLAPRIKEMV